MNNYAQTLESLQEAMLYAKPERVMPGLENNRPSLDKRLNVYIEGYRTRLVQAVLSDYPTAINYLGYAEAEKLAKAYVECTPSISYTLDNYPLKFAEYVEQYGNDGFASSLARLESAIAEVFWLPDSTSFTPPVDLTPEQLMELSFLPRNAAKLIYLEYPAEEYMVALREGREANAADKNPCYMLIIRHKNEVRRHMLEDTEQLILSCLLMGVPVGEALEGITGKFPELLPEIEGKLQLWFARWIENGFFTIKTNIV